MTAVSYYHIMYFSVKVAGSWGQWADWSACSTPCGRGVSTRIRLCNNPPPQNGGARCPGAQSTHQICEGTECDGGTQIRTDD